MSDEINAVAEETAAAPKKGIKAIVAFVAVAAVAATGGALIAGSVNKGSNSNTANADPAAAQAASLNVNYGESRGFADVHQDEVLVSTEWLAENLNDPNLVIIEVSENRPNSGLTLYNEGHIPGSIELVWYDDFVQQLNRDLVGKDDFTALAQNIGVNSDSTVILYGDANNWFAAYGAWVFKLYGTEDVRLLDGGRKKWEAEGRELSNVAPNPEKGNYIAKEPNRDLRAFQADVLEVALAASASDAPTALVDIRGPAEFKGEIGVAEGFTGEAAAKWGHVPNAVNVPWGSIVNEDGTYKSADEIREVYAAVGVDGSKPVIVYCRIGERASHTWFALTQILGYEVKVYDGSWTEWGNSVGVPVVNETLGEGERSGLWSSN